MDDVAVVGRADEHAGAEPGRRGRSGDRRPALDQRLQRPEAAGRLDQLIETVAGRDRSAPVRPPRDRSARDRTTRDRIVPALVHHHRFEREPCRPPGSLEPGPHRAFVGPAEAQVGDRIDARRDAEHPAEIVGAVEADPADPQAFGARGQPEVLDRAGRAVDVGLGNRPPAEDLDLRIAVVAADDDPERRLDHPLDFLVEELPGALVEAIGLAQTLTLGEPADLRPGAGRAHDDQAPRLHKPDRRRAVGRLEDATQHVGGHLVGPEAADVAPLGNDTVHGGPRLVRITPTSRVRGAFRRAGRIESRRCGRTDESIRSRHRREQ